MVREADRPSIPSEPTVNGLARTQQRAQLRRELLDARSEVAFELRARQLAAMAPRLDALVAQRTGPMAGKIIGVYWPIRGEPDLRSLFVEWHARGAVLALPVVDAQATPLRFVRWAPDDALVKGLHGVPVPQHGATVIPDLLIIPCVGFDARGYRLGYGSGYYDRTLALAQPQTIGVAWSEALLPQFEPEATDRPLDAIVTPDRVWDSVRQQGISPA